MKLSQVQKGLVVKMVCTAKRVCLGLEEGDSFLVTIVDVAQYKSWESMVSDSDLNKLAGKKKI